MKCFFFIIRKLTTCNILWNAKINICICRGASSRMCHACLKATIFKSRSLKTRYIFFHCINVYFMSECHASFIGVTKQGCSSAFVFKKIGNKRFARSLGMCHASSKVTWNFRKAYKNRPLSRKIVSRKNVTQHCRHVSSDFWRWYNRYYVNCCPGNHCSFIISYYTRILPSVTDVSFPYMENRTCLQTRTMKFTKYNSNKNILF